MKVYQIEISNLCNLTCTYCPHPNQRRPKGLMTLETFKKSIDLIIKCGQRIACLHNFGEPLMHPDLSTFIKYANALGVKSSFYTNGVLLHNKVLNELFDAGLREICVSGHAAGEIERVNRLILDSQLPLRISETFRPSKRENHGWARQVSLWKIQSLRYKDHIQTAKPCVFEKQNAFVILWDGRINGCCIDAQGLGVSGTVDDLLIKYNSYQFTRIPTCDHCSLMKGDERLD